MSNGRGMKIGNEYARNVMLYERIPKAVFAAVAYSFASRLIEDENPAMIEAAILREWQTLHDNGIVAQKVEKS